MKKYLVIAVSAIALASCSSDAYLGDNVENTQTGGNGAISFNLHIPNFQKATASHAASADSLNNQFVVWGEKSNAAETGSAGTPVFINYVVNYGATTANTSESNSSDWEYVGQTPYADTKVVASAAPTAVTEQTIKYWDFTNKYYTFTAFSALPADIANGKVGLVTKTVSGSTVYDKGYTMLVKAGASVGDIYFSDRKPVEAATGNKETAVELTFRKLVAQVRFGFYETIPGYSVKITDVKFNSNASHTADGNGNFGVDGSIVVPGASTSYTVTYDDGAVIGANRNKAKVAVSTPNNQGFLATKATSFFGTTLGVTANAPLYENAGNYTPFLPNTSNSTDLTLKISYTLTSTDGSNETINITDATAKIPAAYAQWKSNYAYTYLFKISDNTNGSSGQSIPGLYPITFNAVVETGEDGLQQTITTVATPSITTYANDAAATPNNEYLPSKNIYVVVDNAGTLIEFDGSNAKMYKVTNDTGSGTAQEITEASVANALANATPTDANTDGTPDTWTVTGVGMKSLIVTTIGAPALTAVNEIPAADSPTGVAIAVDGTNNKAVKFVSASGTYAFEYTDGSSNKYYKIIKVQ